MIDVNIKGVLTGTKAVLQDMISRKAGTIINISSIAGRKTFDEHAVYCASKYAFMQLQRACARKRQNTMCGSA